MRNKLIFSWLLISLLSGVFWWQRSSHHQPLRLEPAAESLAVPDVLHLTNPLQIEVMRRASYPGSPIQVVENLSPGSNYQRFLVSYESDGNTIYALMTIPNGQKPETGWPVIVFNHGYIEPSQYRTLERYVAYVDSFARQGYLVFKSDYRGHGNSEGEPEGAYGSSAYTRDVLNAVSSLKMYPMADANRIGVWGHSMGGFITLRSMVVTSDIKAGVIWGGVVAPYEDMLNNWRRRANINPPPNAAATTSARSWRNLWQAMYGSPEANPDFWRSVSANAYVADLSGPLQLHHARGDQTVPWEFSQTLANQVTATNREVELYLYTGDDHNITSNFSVAMQRSVEFFDRVLKEHD